MPRRIPTALERLQALEVKKQDIIQQRKNDLLGIIESCNALTIDDHLLAGFLLFATDPGNKNHPTLQEFKEVAKPFLVKVRTRKAKTK